MKLVVITRGSPPVDLKFTGGLSGLLDTAQNSNFTSDVTQYVYENYGIKILQQINMIVAKIHLQSYLHQYNTYFYQVRQQFRVKVRNLTPK